MFLDLPSAKIQESFLLYSGDPEWAEHFLKVEYQTGPTIIYHEKAMNGVQESEPTS